MNVEDSFERLVAAGIELLRLPSLQTHFVFHRDGFAALVERTASGFGGIGAAGLLTGKGLAPLVWRGERPVFAGKGSEQAASTEQVDSLRRFAADLEKCLRGA